MTNGWNGLYLLDSDNVNSLTSPALHFECLLATSVACLSSEMDEKLIELVRKCEVLYDMSNKKYSESVCKEKTEYYRLAQHCNLLLCHICLNLSLISTALQWALPPCFWYFCDIALIICRTSHIT